MDRQNYKKCSLKLAQKMLRNVRMISTSPQVLNEFRSNFAKIFEKLDVLGGKIENVETRLENRDVDT
jgi:hypothetical protein